MTKRSNTFPLHRVAIAMMDDTSDTTSLEVISKLAAKAQAEMSGVFIEDLEMLRAARLPFAREICQITNTVRPADVTNIERALKQYANTARARIAALASRSGAHWTFEVVRKNRASAVLELARGTDVTFFSSRATFQQHSLTRSSNLALSEPHRPVVVIVDRSVSGNHAAQIAKQLAAESELPIFAIVPAANEAGADELVDRLTQQEGYERKNVQILLRPTFSQIIDTTRGLHPSTVIVPITLIEDSPARIEELEHQLDHCILLVK